MNKSILYLFTRTPLHVGAGSSVGAVDQPIQRERHTGFPIIPGSSIKGVIRDFFQIAKSGDDAFGKEATHNETNGEIDSGHAGSLSFSEAKLLLFPVRSAKGAFALATCPHVLGRFKRDASVEFELPKDPGSGNCFAGSKVSVKNGEKRGIILEEYCFNQTDTFPDSWAKLICGVLQDPTLESSADRLVYLSDEDFAYFTQNACQVLQHNRIDPETGIVEDKALFNEEVVPAESLFYATIHYDNRNLETVEPILRELGSEQIMQFGGKETTGLGFSTVKVAKGPQS